MFRTHIHTVHDGVATEQTVRVIQIVQTLIGAGVAGIRNKTVRI
jgi:hypothetical protein